MHSCCISVNLIYQVRLPNGGSMRQSFLPESTLNDVLVAVASQCPEQINLVQVCVLYILQLS